MNNPKLLGKIIDSFTMQDKYRVIVLDRDCSADLKSGDMIEVVFSSGQSTSVNVTDAILANGPEFGAREDKIASLQVENIGFPQGPISGSRVFLRIIK